MVCNVASDFHLRDSGVRDSDGSDAGRSDPRIGVIGATSLVGTCLLQLLTEAGHEFSAFTRGAKPEGRGGVRWHSIPSLPANPIPAMALPVRLWVCVAPIWALPDYYPMLEAHGARRVVVLSSTSRFSKADSSDRAEQAVARRLSEGESRLQDWARRQGIEWVILRPTLIYGLGRDKNIAELARFVRRFRFFVLSGKASGLRQPVHGRDVARACLAALRTPVAANRAYALSGGETLTYRDMVARIFCALELPVRMVSVPVFGSRCVLTLLRLLPHYRDMSPAMAERMNRDLVFDHGDAVRDLGFSPCAFELTGDDVNKRTT